MPELSEDVRNITGIWFYGIKDQEDLFLLFSVQIQDKLNTDTCTDNRRHHNSFTSRSNRKQP